MMMARTTGAVPGLALRPEFDPFLFASLGVDRNEMEVSVLSGLARSDLDPWQEAAELTALPCKAAVERLAARLEAMQGRTWTQPEARAVAMRLIALLPRTLAGPAESVRTPDSLGAMVNSRPWWVYLLLISLVLGSQLLVAIHPPSPAQHQDDAPSAAEVVPPQPPVNSDQ